MTIWVNQQSYQFESELNLLDLLTKLDKSNKTGIAIAVNNQVISKTNWQNTIIKNQDKITIITATQGG